MLSSMTTIDNHIHQSMPRCDFLNCKYPCSSVNGRNLTPQRIPWSHYLVCILLSIINIMQKPPSWKVLWRIAITPWRMTESCKWHRSMSLSELVQNIERLSMIKYMSPKWCWIQTNLFNLLGRSYGPNTHKNQIWNPWGSSDKGENPMSNHKKGRLHPTNKNAKVAY